MYVGNDTMILLLLKGFFIGLFMLIPGVSGGSIAILFNEYDKMVYHTSNLFKEFKKSFFLFVDFVNWWDIRLIL